MFYSPSCLYFPQVSPPPFAHFLAITCTDGKFPALVVKHFTSYPTEETFNLFLGAEMTGTPLLTYKGFSTNGNTEKTWDVCLSPGEYTLQYVDTFGDGWGSSTNPAYVYIQAGGITLFRGGLPYQSGTTLKNGSDTFNLNPTLSFSATWKYTDTAPASNWNTPSFSDLSWSTANSQAMPAFSAVTRYYRVTTTVPALDSFSSYVLSLLTSHGAVIYVQGTEVYRNRVPADATSTTSATGTPPSSPKGTAISFNKFVLPSSGSITIAIEIHHSAGSLGPDNFVFGAQALGTSTVGSCTDNFFRRGTGVSTPASTSSYYNVNYVFNENNLYYYYITSSSTATLTYTLPENGAVWINRYEIMSGSSTTYGYPKKWTVHGSNDGSTWVFIDQRENVLFTATRQTKSFNVRSNTGSYKMYKFTFLENTVSNRVSIGKIKAYACTYPQLAPGLQYDSSVLTGVANVDSFDIVPASSGYQNFSIDNTLPAGLTFSTSSGTITGIATAAFSGNFVISATDVQTGVSSSFSFSLTITLCTKPNVQLRFRKINKSSASQEHYTVNKADGTAIFTSPEFVASVDYTHLMCIPAQVITVNIWDTGNNGWYTNAGLYIDYYSGEENTYHTMAFLYERAADTVRAYKFDLNYPLYNHESTWKYLQGSTPANWYATTEPAGFSNFPMSPLPATTSNVWLFRNTFTVASKSGYAGLDVRVKSRAGLLLYINGNEIFREFLPDGEISTSTIPTGGATSTTYKSISVSTKHVNTGSNTIAIAIVNLPSSNPTTVLFDCMINMISENPPSRNWGLTLTSDPSSSSSSAYLIDNLLTTHWIKTNPTKFDLSITFDYGADRRETFNKNCIASSNYVNAYDPSDWAIYGSNDGETMTLIANVTNAYYSSRRQERCFYMPNSVKPWRYYRFLFTESAILTAEPYGYGMSEIANNLVDIESMDVPALQFSETTYIGYIGVPFPEATPNDSRYSNFRINPPLQLPLEIDTTTGSIRGTPNAELQRATYTITATSPKGQDSSTTVTLGVETCQYPKIMFTLLIVSGTNGNQMGYNLKTRDGTTLGSRIGFTENQSNYFPFCQPLDTYTLTLTDSSSNGWNTGYFRVLLEDGTVIARGSLGDTEGNKVVPLSLNYVVSPVRTLWSYYNKNTAPAPNWNKADFTETWDVASSGNFGAPQGMTQYFRYVFTVDSMETYSSVVFNINTRYGVVVYINGELLYSSNLPSSGVDFSTPALFEYDEKKTFGSSTSFAFGPLHAGSNTLAIEVHRVEQPKYNEIDFDANVLLTADDSYRVLDGVGSTSSEADSTVSLLFDNTKGTVFTSTAACTAATPTWAFNNDRQEYISSYTLITGASCNQRHPSTWRLEGSNDGSRWAVLHRVMDHKFTTFRSTASFDFFNDKAYNQFRLNVESCQSADIGTPASTCYTGEVRNFQLAEFALYTKRLVASCPPTEDGFSGAVNDAYAYKICPTYKSGRIQALCTNGVLGTPEDLCVVDPIRSISYLSPILNVYRDVPFSYDLTVEGLEFSCYTEPGALQYGLQFEASTGRLYGTPTEVFSNYGVTVTCTNAATVKPVTTRVVVNAAEKPGLPVWVWIVFAVIAVIVILVLVLCIVNRGKSRSSSKGHSNLEKKLSTRTSSKARQSSRRGSDGTAKVVKV